MRSLYLRIWLTVIVTLALFAGASGWLVQRHLDQEHARNQAALTERIAAWGDLIQRSLPAASAPPEVQSEALRDWSQRLRVPMALEDEQGHRIAASDSFVRREGDKQLMHVAIYQIKLDDGRSLYVMRPNMLKPPPAPTRRCRRTRTSAASAPSTIVQANERGGPPPFLFPGVPRGVSPGLSLLALVVVLFLAIAVGAYPIIRRLTRRLETLKRGVEAFGQGALDRRVPVEGRDEVATLATSFNLAAERIEALVRSHKSLLANASHELRSPLARLKMATSLLSDAAPDEREREHLRAEINTDIAELDGLVDEVLLASRLEAAPAPEQLERSTCWRWRWRRAPAWTRASTAPAPTSRARSACCAARCATCWRTRAATAAARSASTCRTRPRPASRSASATTAPACPRPIANASSSRSSACRATPSAPAASDWASRWCARSWSATTAASTACGRPKAAAAS